MSDRPEDRPEERRRTGPLGDDDGAEETRRVPPGDEEATRRIPPERPGGENSSQEATRVPNEEAQEKETRIIRTPGTRGDDQQTRQQATPYPRGYFEIAEEREERLRDMYGGVDWLASFLGFVFAAVAGAILLLLAGFIVVPLGFSFDLGSDGLGATTITGLVAVGVIVFLTFLFGGYVAGRLARFDGGRNGAMTVVWTILVAAVLTVGGILSIPVFEGIRSFIREIALPTLNSLLGAGIVGAVVLVGVVLAALLGGFAGGRLGGRYHRDIDRAT